MAAHQYHSCLILHCTEMTHSRASGRPAPEAAFDKLRSCPTCDWAEERWKEAETEKWRCDGKQKGRGGRKGGEIDADERKGSDSFRREAEREGPRDWSKERSRQGAQQVLPARLPPLLQHLILSQRNDDTVTTTHTASGLLVQGRKGKTQLFLSCKWKKTEEKRF